MRAHGVPWLIRHLSGTIGLAEAVTGSKADTRHYAKRQFTWFRHQMPGWRFVAPEAALDLAGESWERGESAATAAGAGHDIAGI